MRPEIEARMLRLELGIDKLTCCVYLITCKTTGKQYVGQTMGDVVHRMEQHCRSASKGSDRSFYPDMRKYGEEDFECDILFVGKNQEQLWIMEDYYMYMYRTRVTGYNTAKGMRSRSRTEARARERFFKETFGSYYREWHDE